MGEKWWWYRHDPYEPRERRVFSTMAEAHILPVIHVIHSEAFKLKAYFNSASKPEAKLTFKGTSIGWNPHIAPMVASFSSKGPSTLLPGILKPDVIGPGVSILAAWPFPLDDKKQNAKPETFNIMSGTSMSCPHLSGSAALLKSSHPDWSPAAISLRSWRQPIHWTIKDCRSWTRNSSPPACLPPVQAMLIPQGKMTRGLCMTAGLKITFLTCVA